MCDGRYKLRQALGEGGMATVYRAYDTRLDVWRAVKVLSPAMSMSTPMRHRFEAEARMMAQLRHPAVVTVFDVERDQGQAFIVMELMDGGTLEEILADRGGLPVGQALWVIDRVLDGLAAAHAQGVVHRDIKPENILLNAAGQPKLSDFGIARIQDDNHRLTRTGSVLGTWAYMAPEQRTNAKGVDARSDLYSVAATLFAIVSGKEPFDLYTTELHEEMFAGVPDMVRDFISQGARYKPEDRFADAAAMKTALRAVAEHFPMEPLPPMQPRLPPEDAPDEPTVEISMARGSSTQDLPPSGERSRSHPTLNIDDSSPTGFTAAIEPPVGEEKKGGLLVFLMAGMVGAVAGAGWWAMSRPDPAPVSQVTQVVRLIAPPRAGEDPAVEPASEDTGQETAPVADPGQPTPADPTRTPDEAPTETPEAPSKSPWGTLGEGAAPPAGSSVRGTSTPTDARVLDLESWPPADVYINKVKVGRTPLRTQVDTMLVRLSLRTDDGKERSTTGTVAKGEVWRYCWNFDRSAECGATRPPD
ncbi:MAG: protein kinase [Alphaproteobacteria bacterium]|nr:protein kinase [Alphaproteobacteria bacterium]